MDAAGALAELKAGNQRYVQFIESGQDIVVTPNHQPSSAGQAPSAVVVSCSDSRVPVEHVFHCGLGHVFVVRVAGNILDKSQLGSVEYACSVLGARLVVVLGHTHCGAINATVDAQLGDGQLPSDNIATIAEHIKPSVSEAIAEHGTDDVSKITQAAVAFNVQYGCQALRRNSPILAAMHDLDIVGGVYHIDSGKVEFLDPASLPS